MPLESAASKTRRPAASPSCSASAAPSTYADKRPADNAEDLLDEVTKHIDDLNAQLKRLTESFIKGVVEEEMYLQLKSEIGAKLQEARLRGRATVVVDAGLHVPVARRLHSYAGRRDAHAADVRLFLAHRHLLHDLQRHRITRPTATPVAFARDGVTARAAPSRSTRSSAAAARRSSAGTAHPKSRRSPAAPWSHH